MGTDPKHCHNHHSLASSLSASPAATATHGFKMKPVCGDAYHDWLIFRNSHKDIGIIVLGSLRWCLAPMNQIESSLV